MIDLISHDDFGRLRLRDFVPRPREIAVLEEWEFEDDLWIGEALGFTEFLRLDEDPAVLRAVSLHLEALPDDVAARMLEALRLPLRRGMDEAEGVARLGAPREVLNLGPGRRSYAFLCGMGDLYDVACTVEEGLGITHVVMMAPTPRRLAADRREERRAP